MPGNILTISYEKPTQRYTRYLLYAVIEMLRKEILMLLIINEFAQASNHLAKLTTLIVVLFKSFVPGRI